MRGMERRARLVLLVPVLGLLGSCSSRAPAAPDTSSVSTGPGTVVVNVDSRAKAKAFSDGDPFTQNGVFASITITRMRKGQWNPGAAEGA